jgi:hypothetical protein
VTQSLFCSDTARNGGQGNSVTRVALSSQLGPKNFTYQAYTVPDRFRVVYDQLRVINTGFVGDPSYNSELNAEGYSDVVGPGYGYTTFTHSNPDVDFVDVYVDAPLPNTAWAFVVACNSSSPAAPL